jgi:hypothetical protein
MADYAFRFETEINATYSMPLISSKYVSLAVMLMEIVTVPHVESVFRITLTVNTCYFPHNKNQTLFVMKIKHAVS